MSPAKYRRRIGRTALVLLAILAGGCESGTTIEQLLNTYFADPESDAPSFAGIWDLYTKSDEPRYLGRLICDDSGDPREFQGNPRVMSLLGVGGVHLDGKPRSMANGKAYVATASAQQDGASVHAVVTIGVQHETGAIGSATFDFEATLTGIEDLDEAIAIAQSVDFPGGAIIDTAHGILVESGSLIQEPDRKESEVIAIRSLSY